MKNTKKTVDKRQKDIQKKLSAAILMLLVSSIMMVSSTYAWFTLSTAPEVKGVQATIGGNGNLEIALGNSAYVEENGATVDKGNWVTQRVDNMEKDDNTNSWNDNNIYWGNLIDVSSGYGLDEITLYPAALLLEGANNLTADKFISVPEYGSDGRVSGLSSSTVSGTWDGKKFATKGYGVRAVGTSSAKTDREFAYDDALGKINAGKSTTVSQVEDIIGDSGIALGQVAIAYGLSKPIQKSDVALLAEMMKQTALAISPIATAIEYSIIGAIASAEGQTSLNDVNFALVKNYLIGQDSVIKLANIKVGNDEQGKYLYVDKTVTVEDFEYNLAKEKFRDLNLVAIYEQYDEILDTLTEVETNLKAKVATAGDTMAWGDISADIVKLMDTDSKEVTVAGMTLSEIRANQTAAMNKMIAQYSSGIDVILGPDSSVFSDISELVGKLSATVTVDLGSAIESMAGLKAPINIKTKLADNTVPLLTTEHTIISALKAPLKDTSAVTSAVDDTYALAIDLFFRTNATGSNLLLQTTPVDRIYTENESNSSTMGAGSTVKFTTGLDDKQVENLLKSFRVLFLDADDNYTILGEAGFELTYEQDSADPDKQIIQRRNGAIYANLRMYKDDGEGKKVLCTDSDEQKIRSMTANQAHRITILMFLDGETITNADVANAAESLGAEFNFQFSSSIELKPMDYTGLKDANNDEQTEETKTPLATPTFSYAYPTLTVNKVENAETYTYKVFTPAGESQKTGTLTFTDDTATLDVSTVESGGYVVITASATNYTSSTAQWTKE